MVARIGVLCAALLVLLGGCVSPNAPNGVDGPASSPFAAITQEGLLQESPLGDNLVHWIGNCDQGTCPSYAFQLTEDLDQPLYLSIWWDYRPMDGETYAFQGTWTLPAGATLNGEHHDAYASVGVVENPVAGEYRIQPEVQPQRQGHHEFHVTVVTTPDAAPNADGDFLPDLRALEPAHLTIHSDGHVTMPNEGPPFPMAPVTGCQPAETLEQEAMRCLRFGSGFSNEGSGDLLARLDDSNPSAPQWVQIITTVDGEREHRAGGADFHALHAHYHYERALEATVYSYDLETGERGEPVGKSQKTGFCFEDWGLAPGMAPATDGGHYHCFDPDEPFPTELVEATVDPVMGVSAGWFDLYVSYLPDQYVDITGVPDGVYELANVANPDQYLLESDTTNNEASVIFRLTGDDVEIIGPGS